MAFLPLLQGTIELTKMRVHGGEILIERDPNRQLNRADLAESTPGGAHVPASPAPKASPAEASQWVMRLLASLRLSDIAWDDVRITFVDRVGAPGEVVTITVSHVQGQLRNISPMTPMPFDITATVLTDSPRNIRVRGTVGPIPENLDIAGAPIDAQLQAADLLVAHLTPYLGQRFPLSWGRLGADVQVRGSGRGSIRIISALSLTDAALHGPREDEAAIAFPPLTRTQDLTLDLSSASVTLAEAQLHLFNLHASLTGAVSEIRTIPQFDLQLTTNAFAPGELLTQVPLLASAIPVSVDLHGRV